MWWDKGSVKLPLDGLNLIVTEIYYILEQKNNLLSITQLQDKTLTIFWSREEFKRYFN